MVPVLKSLYTFILSRTQGPTIWVPGLLGEPSNKFQENRSSVFVSLDKRRDRSDKRRERSDNTFFRGGSTRKGT